MKTNRIGETSKWTRFEDSNYVHPHFIKGFIGIIAVNLLVFALIYLVVSLAKHFNF